MIEAKTEIKVARWRSHRKDSLQGFLTLEMPSGVVIRDCSYHRRGDGDRWVGLPARQYTKDGGKAWTRIVDFIDKQSYQRFQKGALAAVDRYFAGQASDPRASPRQTINQYLK